MGSYVCFLYEKEWYDWYDSINEEVSAEENYILVRFSILLIHQYIFIGLELTLNVGCQ